MIDPGTEKVLCEMPEAGGVEARLAIDAAAMALPIWQCLPVMHRSQLLRKIHDLMLEYKEPLARLLSLEQGKPLVQAAGEVQYAAGFYAWFSEEARRLPDYLVPNVPGERTLVEHVPVGVVAAITPWNFPIAQAAKKVAAALAAGCTVVLKPSEETPLTSLATAWIAQRAGVPAGVLNVVGGRAAEIGDVFIEDPRVRVISLTGSLKTGREIMSRAGLKLKRVSLELGGNAPFIVMEDADLEFAAEELVKLKSMVSGQVCVTANRIFIHSSVKSRFVKILVDKVLKLKPGNGLKKGMDLGPLIHRGAVEKVQALVDQAIMAGAKCLVGKKDFTLPRKGFYFAPTVLDEVENEMTLCGEEIFGPVYALQGYDDLDEVVKLSNASEYGLSAYIYSKDKVKALAIARRLEVGIVGINHMRPLRVEAPFGGVKSSGIGREGGKEGLLEFLDIKVIGGRF